MAQQCYIIITNNTTKAKKVMWFFFIKKNKINYLFIYFNVGIYPFAILLKHVLKYIHTKIKK